MGLRKKLKELIERPAGRFLRPMWARLQSVRHIARLPETVHDELDYEGELPAGVELLISCKTGILFYRDGTLRRILSGQFYGLAVSSGRWYAFHRITELIGQIVSFELEDGWARDVRSELSLLDPEIHQIDFCGHRLWITETGRNRLLLREHWPDRKPTMQVLYPNGRAPLGRKSPTYAHINSVLSDGETTLLVYHNHTNHTGRKSEAVWLDDRLQVVRRQTLNAGCAHNIAVVDGHLCYCDSQGGDLVVGSKRLPLGTFTRGIALADDVLYVGGSDFAERSKREQSAGLVYACARDGSALLSKLTMPSVGGVYEVRLLSQEDGAQSEYYRRMREEGQWRLSEIGVDDSTPLDIVAVG